MSAADPKPAGACPERRRAMSTTRLALRMAGGMIAGNYTYQWLGPGQYAVAFERSLFAAIPLVILAIALAIRERKER
jgi:hypothetical protein